jgi:choline-glycine betaine transporter
MNDTELISSEIGYFKPRISRRRQLIEAILGALAIAAFVAFMIWFATL